MGLAALCWVKLPRRFEHLGPARTTEAVALHRAMRAFLLPAHPPGREIARRDTVELPRPGSWRAQPPVCNLGNTMWTSRAHPQPPGRASLPCSRDQGDAAGSGAEAGAPRHPPRHGGGRRTRDLPHLPARQRGGELMRSKVRGRRRADNLLAPQAAGGVRVAEGRHLPPPPRHLQPHNEVITGPLLDGRHQHLSPLRPPNSHLWLRER